MRRTAVALVLMVMAAAVPVVRGVAKDAPAGSAGGLTGSGSQQFTEDSPGVPDTVEGDNLWGEALTASAP